MVQGAICHGIPHNGQQGYVAEGWKNASEKSLLWRVQGLVNFDMLEKCWF